VHASLGRGMVARPSTYTTYLYRGFVKPDQRTGSCPEGRSRSSKRCRGAHGSSWTLQGRPDDRQASATKSARHHRSVARPECHNIVDSPGNPLLSCPKEIPAPGDSCPRHATVREELATRAGSRFLPGADHRCGWLCSRRHETSCRSTRSRCLIFNRTALVVDMGPKEGRTSTNVRLDASAADA
jgi:hypothetical protein